MIQSKRLRPDEVIELETRQRLPTSLSVEETQELLSDLLGLLQEAISSPRLDFLDPFLSDEDYKAWTGWSKVQYDQMFDIISPSLRSSINRHARNTFALFWIKFKTNLSFGQIASLLNIPGNSETKRKRAADAFESVMEKMVEHLVPKYLGIEHLSREEAKKHNTSFVKVKYIIFPLNIHRKRQWLNSHKHEPFLTISIIL